MDLTIVVYYLNGDETEQTFFDIGSEEEALFGHGVQMGMNWASEPDMNFNGDVMASPKVERIEIKEPGAAVRRMPRSFRPDQLVPRFLSEGARGITIEVTGADDEDEDGEDNDSNMDPVTKVVTEACQIEYFDQMFELCKKVGTWDQDEKWPVDLAEACCNAVQEYEQYLAECKDVAHI